MRHLDREAIAAFVRDELLNPERRAPIVAISTLPQSQASWVDPAELAAELAGVAEVVVVETGDPTWELARYLPPRLDVYGGALRVWWPGLGVGSDPYDHKLYFVHSEAEARVVRARIVQAVRPLSAPSTDAGSEREVAWQRIATEWSPGDVVEGRVKDVKDFGCFIELLPDVVGLVHKSEVDWTFVSDPGDFMRPGTIVKVQILSIDSAQRRIELSLKRALTGTPRAPIALAPGAEPFVWKAGRTEPGRSGSSAAVAELQERLEQVSQEAVEASAARLGLAEEIKSLRTQLTESKRALRSEKDALAALERRVSAELDPLSSERAFLLAVRLCHARTFDEDSRAEHPLRRMLVGRRFLASARELDGLDIDKLIEVCTQVACDVARSIPGREVHPLRSGERGAGNRRRASDGANAWRCSLQDGTPAARRVHWWSVPGPEGGTVEFGLACLHDEFDIPE